ncbi:TolC family protein [Oligoflexaceae bacterium]|nr:TolC family protein [Oligoflexaceae bacterium]
MKVFIAVIITASSWQQLSAQSLNKVLEDVRRSSLSFKKEHANYQAKSAEIDAADQVYDFRLGLDIRRAKDGSAQNNRFSGDERRRNEQDVHISKQFITGTQVKLGYKREWHETEFPPATPPQTLPDGTVVPGQDSSSATRFNPGYFNTFSLTLLQPLYKNFMSRQVEHQKELLKKAAEIPRYSSLLLLQADQFKAESLYWRLIAANKKLLVVKQIFDKSREFSKQMGRQVKIGRAENVDLADAEARVLNTETSLVELEMVQLDIKTQLLNLMGVGESNLFEGPLDEADLKLQHKTADEAAAFAVKSRLDLRMISARKSMTESQKLIAEEDGKWDISLYAAYDANAIATSQSESFKEAKDRQNVRTVYGIKMDMPIGGDTASLAKIKARSYEAAALETERQDVLRTIKQGLRIAYLRLSSSKRKVGLIQQQISSLKKKKSEEQQKLRQARSDRVAVIRYEMEVLNAELELINSHEAQRLAEAECRFLIHGYPAGAK